MNSQAKQNHLSYKMKHTLQERIAKAKHQRGLNPEKVVLIVEKNKKSSLPVLQNPRFLCQKTYKFSLVKSMIEKKLKETSNNENQSKNSFFVYVNGIMPNPESTMVTIYDKYKDEDGFLYMTYSDQETL